MGIRTPDLLHAIEVHSGRWGSLMQAKGLYRAGRGRWSSVRLLHIAAALCAMGSTEDPRS